jgi:hypothetical protein
VADEKPIEKPIMERTVAHKAAWMDGTSKWDEEVRT